MDKQTIMQLLHAKYFCKTYRFRHVLSRLTDFFVRILELLCFLLYIGVNCIRNHPNKFEKKDN